MRESAGEIERERCAMESVLGGERLIKRAARERPSEYRGRGERNRGRCTGRTLGEASTVTTIEAARVSIYGLKESTRSLVR